jgi:hypothetical protein
MNEHRVKYIQSGGLQIVAACESVSGDSASEKVTEIYHPDGLLLYTQIGKLHIKIDEKVFEVPKENFAILRKYTEASLYKTWTKEERLAKTYAFGLNNDFIKKVIHKIKLPRRTQNITDKIIKIPTSKKLSILMLCLITHIDEVQDIDANTIEEKTLETLQTLAETDPNVFNIFN